jgi:hypothetical protein
VAYPLHDRKIKAVIYLEAIVEMHHFLERNIRMINEQKTREWIDFLIATGAWVLSVYAMATLLRIFIMPHIPM